MGLPAKLLSPELTVQHYCSVMHGQLDYACAMTRLIKHEITTSQQIQ
jgi:hypothetical protein